MEYFYLIPGMKHALERERAELEDEYNGLRGTVMDAMPHSSTPGKPTEALAEKLAARDVHDRMEAISVRIAVLNRDREEIQSCLDALNGDYKNVISWRYRDGYTWERLSRKRNVPERTARRWFDRAVFRFGEAMDDVPMVDEILLRASRARV